MEIFYEQNVANPNIDKHKKRTVVLSVLRIVLLAIGIIAGLFLLGFGVQIGKGALTTVIQLGMVVLSVAPFVLTYILLGRFLRNSNTEYDYRQPFGLLPSNQSVASPAKRMTVTPHPKT